MVKRIKLSGMIRYKFLSIVVACLLPAMFSSGCQWPLKTRPTVLPSGFSPRELERYNGAKETYLKGRYDASAQQFALLREQTANPAMARMALYGLACSKLMVANTPKAYHEALGLWQTWVQCAVPAKEHEDPVLFKPIVENKLLVSKIPLNADSNRSIEEGDYIKRWYIVRTDQEIARLRDQLEVANQKVENRDKKIKAYKAEIVRLNEQIKAFETIDQKIQKKKNAIPSSD